MNESDAGPVAGKLLSERAYVVTEGALADYYNGLKLAPRTDGLVPTTVASDAENGYFSEIAFPNHVGHLWMRQGWECFGSMKAGGTYAASGRIRDIYAHRDRSVVYYEVDVKDAAGAVVVRTHHHQSFLREKPAGGTVAFRDPNRKPGARKFDVPPGERFGGLSRTITLEMCGEYFHGDANYHTDKAASAELGFQDVVVGGRMTLAYAAHILEERFGDAWWRSGRLNVKFTNPTWPNDTLTVHGVATGVVADTAEAPGNGERQGAFVWIAKSDDTVVLVGEASVAA